MRVTLVITTLLLAGCRAPEAKPESFEIQLLAHDGNGQGLADARFWADGRPLGTSDANGQLRVKLEGRADQAVALTTACPAGYRTQEPQRPLVLRRVRAQENARAILELRASCSPLERAVALVVRATGPRTSGMPIRVRGEVVGQTDADGLAHLLLKARPHSTLRVTLDSSAEPKLRPRDPVHTFEVTDVDAVVLIEQPFERSTTAVRRRAALPSSPPKLPYRID
jgi:hypothetical protein